MKVNAKGQIVIPKPLMEQYDLRSGDEVEFIPRADGIFMRKRVEGNHPVDRIRGTVKLRGADSVDELIAWRAIYLTIGGGSRCRWAHRVRDPSLAHMRWFMLSDC